MKRIIYLLGLITLINGCVTAPPLPLELVEKEGVEKTLDYSYKKVFYACDEALNIAVLYGQWYSKETNFVQGYISVVGAAPAAVKAAVVVKKIDENKTIIKVKEIKRNVTEDFYKNFFENLERILKREERK